MKITFDKESDAVYIYFKDILPGEIKNTISLNESVNIDLGIDEKIFGIEILDASKNLSPEYLNSVIMVK